MARILDDLRRVGVRIVDPSAWLDQDSGQRQLITEAEQVLAHCRTPRTAAVAADQVRGAMLHWAQAEIVRLDTPSDETVMKDQAAAERARLQAFHRRCETLLQDAEFGVHLTEPFHVVLAGRPNVGKSSLINALLGYERSITYDQPGTTRDLLHAETVLDGIPIRLTDTAGLRDSREPIESQGVSRARGLLADADLLVWVQDVKLDDGGKRLPDDRAFPVEWSASDRQLWVLNKCDRLPPGGGGAPKSAEASCTFDRQLAVSATTGVGIQTMQQAIVALLVPRFPPPRSAVPITERQRRCLLHASAAGSVAEAIDWLKRLKGDRKTTS